MSRHNSIIFAGYRGWALKIFEFLEAEYTSYTWHLAKTPAQLDDLLQIKNVGIVILAGWSWIIKNDDLSNNLFVGLHPSDLPNYSGGSPIQNQILRGVYDSAVTVFRMNKKIDRGPIFMQKKLSLKGDINEIFLNISKIGTKITFKLLSKFSTKKLIFSKQKGKASFYKRRTEKDNQKKLK